MSLNICLPSCTVQYNDKNKIIFMFSIYGVLFIEKNWNKASLWKLSGAMYKTFSKETCCFYFLSIAIRTQ